MAAGERALVERTAEDHAALRALALGTPSADIAQDQVVRAFEARPKEHVRFEEDELFAACETRLPEAVLEAVARRAPKRIKPAS